MHNSDSNFLHNHPDFSDLILIVAEKESVDPVLVEKDYWIMNCLYGLQKLGLDFKLKGGTSLAKGYGLIHRFSEDIDIQIEPPHDMEVKTARNQNKTAHIESRKKYYDWLATIIEISGIENVERDTEFDDPKYRSGGIRLYYKKHGGSLSGLKDGILLEVGFDDVTPNSPRTISSWAFEHALSVGVSVFDNRAIDVACYDPGYTLVEKLQTISTKFRLEQETGLLPQNFIRHYYDVYCLLQDTEVLKFVGTKEYQQHKEKRFRGADNPNLTENDAFILRNNETRATYMAVYEKTSSLYYKSQPDFQEILAKLNEHINQL
jgi:hypothetical protein